MVGWLTEQTNVGCEFAANQTGGRDITTTLLFANYETGRGRRRRPGAVTNDRASIITEPLTISVDRGIAGVKS